MGVCCYLGLKVNKTRCGKDGEKFAILQRISLWGTSTDSAAFYLVVSTGTAEFSVFMEAEKLMFIHKINSPVPLSLAMRLTTYLPCLDEHKKTPLARYTK